MKKGGGTNKKDSQNNYKEHLLQVVYRDPQKMAEIKVLLVLKRGQYLIASEIDTNNGYEITCLWKAKYNIHVYMIQTNADFIFSKTCSSLKIIVFVTS